MTAAYNFLIQRIIRLGHWLSLIFFVCLFVQGCRQKDGGISIIWKGKKAVGISISKTLIDGEFNESFKDLQVQLKGNETAMLGNYKMVEREIEFTPLIPLSHGSEYEIIYKNKRIGIVEIPLPDATTAAYVINVFPAADTVPVNLLKIYIQFSAPMREGEALQHIHLLNDRNDTVPGVFLDLQPELWDTNQTILTVWLDPGRIKRDLIPNQKLGNPLQQGKHYNLYISNKWKDVQGLLLRQPYTRSFVAGARDSISPQPEQWMLELPAANTTEGLGINFYESLDYFLLGETLRIFDKNGNVITGKGGPLSNGTGFAFWPDKPWQPGRYTLQIASPLEDLAGNNINRLFDRDLRVKNTNAEKQFVGRNFVIAAKLK